jgi:hypothetical protein
MAYNEFIQSIGEFYLGLFEVPVANVNTHPLQRAPDEEYLPTLVDSLSRSKDAYVHPGTAVLNSVVVPRNSEGKPDPKQMKLTVTSSGHHCTATMRMDWPEEKKTWVFHVYLFRMSSLHLIQNCLLTVACF